MSMPERILSVLSESPLPVPTPDLVTICAAGLSNPRARVWAALRKFASAGLVAKVPGVSRACEGRGANQWCAAWRLK